MKRVIATLVLSLSIATLVGCGSGTPTGGGSKGTTPAPSAATKS